MMNCVVRVYHKDTYRVSKDPIMIYMSEDGNLDDVRDLMGSKTTFIAEVVDKDSFLPIDVYFAASFDEVASIVNGELRQPFIWNFTHPLGNRQVFNLEDARELALALSPDLLDVCVETWASHRPLITWLQDQVVWDDSIYFDWRAEAVKALLLNPQHWNSTYTLYAHLCGIVGKKNLEKLQARKVDEDLESLPVSTYGYPDEEEVGEFMSIFERGMYWAFATPEPEKHYSYNVLFSDSRINLATHIIVDSYHCTATGFPYEMEERGVKKIQLEQYGIDGDKLYDGKMTDYAWLLKYLGSQRKSTLAYRGKV